MAGTVISSAVRNNLLALQNTTSMQATLQNRLATGKKVNSALDNPANFFTASSLNNRASGLSSLLDGMANGIKTLEAADNGMKAITKNIESMQANIRQARADKSFQGKSVTIDTTTIGTSAVKNLSFSGGSVGTTPVNIALNTADVTATNATLTGASGFAAGTGTNEAGTAGTFTIQAAGLNGGNAVSVTIAADDDVDDVLGKINTALDGATGGDGGITASKTSGQLVLTGTTGNNITVASSTSGLLGGIGFGSTTASTNGVPGVTGAVKTVDQLVADINGNNSLAGKVRASNDGGKLRVENLSTTDLSVVGMSASAVTGGTGTSNTQTVGGNEVRKNLVSQFNDLRTQIDKLANDASYNGINLLKADKLKLTFNENGTNNIEIQAKNVSGTVRAIDLSENSLNVGAATDAEFSDDAQLDARLDVLSKAVTTLATQASSFGSALSTIQNREEFTKSMINTLQSGADSLVNADLNEESATLLALNTRQQLSQTALSLASQADQAVLRLF
ncbi:flagellin [Enterovirga sp. CN4-39]|uniref:flagellin N-terminal helical domain-containing protein n=1 Tax=Enterovirga sp. CN4-39 TaxID=3400910 RepID=UPI003C0666A7